MIAWIGRRRIVRSGVAEKSDAEISADVRACVEEVVAPYLESGAVAVSRDGVRSSWDPDSLPELALTIKPRNSNAASVSLWVFGEVCVEVGSGNVELWPDAEEDWLPDLKELLVAIADGRYREEVSEGWVFERKVLMRFEGTRRGSARYACFAYEEVDGPPPVGKFSYEAWQPACKRGKEICR